jgi:uroporphyrinogen decarboxylase
MTKRDVVKQTLSFQQPPYVPWQLGFTVEARAKLAGHFGEANLDAALQNHFVELGNPIGFFADIGPNLVQDAFGVVWDRSIDKDIGNVRGQALPQPSLKGFTFPNPADPRVFHRIPALIEQYSDRFRVFSIGFSLYERAWTLRGLDTLMVDFLDHPGFVHDLLNAIADWNITQVSEAVKYDIDAIYFGDDWGQQRGLQMGPGLWREFILPPLTRMYQAVRDASKYVMIHSCGDVDELFDALIAIGLNCFNPFQPEVMDVDALMARYRGRLAFHGGLSTQKALPYGSVDDVRQATRHLLDMGRIGGYVFAPAHDVEGDVPLENMLVFIEVLQEQQGWQRP